VVKTGIILVLAAACVGCSGSTDDGDEATGSLRGTWDVVGSSLGRQESTFVVTLEPSSFTVVTADDSLHVLLAGDGADIAFSYSRQIDSVVATQGAHGQANLGALPIDISGDWNFSSSQPGGGNCSWSLEADAVSGSCNESNFRPIWAPDPGTGTMTGRRTRAAQSMFGDLGGEWTLNFTDGGSLTAVFEGNNMALTLSDEIARSVRWFNLTFDGDSAYGTADGGLEFSANRR